MIGSLEINLGFLDAIQAWLGTPVNSAQPGVTYGMILIFIIIIIIFARWMEGNK